MMNKGAPTVLHRKLGMLGAWLFLAAASLGHAAAADSTHADDQLAAIVADRPRLAASLERRPAVRAWILERFRVTEPPLYWDAARPVSGRNAECDARDPERSYVRIDAKPSGIDQLTFLIFELHNIQGYQAFDAIHEAALRGEVAREEYAEAMLEQEFQALLAARRFYRDQLADLSAAERSEARAYWRLLHGTDSFAEHVQESIDRGHDLLDHWRGIFDSEVATELER